MSSLSDGKTKSGKASLASLPPEVNAHKGARRFPPDLTSPRTAAVIRHHGKFDFMLPGTHFPAQFSRFQNSRP